MNTPVSKPGQPSADPCSAPSTAVTGTTDTAKTEAGVAAPGPAPDPVTQPIGLAGLLQREALLIERVARGEVTLKAAVAQREKWVALPPAQETLRELKTAGQAALRAQTAVARAAAQTPGEPLPQVPPPVLAAAPASARPHPASPHPAPQKPAQARPAQPQAPKPVPAPNPIVTVGAARMQLRHYFLIASFLLLVALPSALYGFYLYTVASDQYESDVGFGSRTQEASNTFDILGVLGGAGAASTKDMDILNQFVTSQELVERVDRRLDLRKIYARNPEDWLFSFPSDGPIEDLVEYWNDMVVVNYDSTTGLMSLRVFAFTPDDAKSIAQEIVRESAAIINELSKTAQEDTTRYARETLAKAEDRYRAAQKALTDFRIQNHIVDPATQLAGASQIVNTLLQQMAEAQIQLDLLTGQVADSDPRIQQLTRRMEVIEKRLAEERAKVGGLSDTSDPGYASLVSDYQNLVVENEFGQKAYLAAQGAYDQAVTEANQQTHYLATFLSPTLPQSSTAPDRPLHILMTALAGFLAWAMGVMVYYALRDRR